MKVQNFPNLAMLFTLVAGLVPNLRNANDVPETLLDKIQPAFAGDRSNDNKGHSPRTIEGGKDSPPKVSGD